jgi:phthalate 3,4-dioxygenase beta subunit
VSADVYVPALPHDDRRHLAAHHFLVEEAAVLDARAWEQWLRMLHDDIRYVMPVRVNTAVGAGFDERDDMAHFDENAHTLRKRIERLRTEHAWTEDPPSRTRHIVSNVRTHAGESDDELLVSSSVLLLRSRGDTRASEVVSAGRDDRLVRVDGRWLLRARHLVVDEPVLRTQNLAIFL